MTTAELKSILAAHAAWLREEPDGKWANLTGADLTNTCLDPSNSPNADWPAAADANGYVTGYRSRRGWQVVAVLQVRPGRGGI